MKRAPDQIRFFTCFLLFVIISSLCTGQVCNRNDASGCSCKDTASKNCYLLPDLNVSSQAITDSLGFIEFPQTGAGTNYAGHGSDDGRIRITIATPNVGYGPLHILGTDTVVCGSDTFPAYSGLCSNGKIPSRLILQRVYQKDGNTMRHADRIAGTMTFHPYHGHMHVDDWAEYSLRIKKNGEADPLKWPVIGKSAKMGYCLMDIGSCSKYNGWCRDDNDSILTDQDFPNSGLGDFRQDCGEKEQGISSGYLDVYASSLYGMWLDVPPGTCNGNYYLVVVTDPFNHFLESDESNNVLVVPVTLKKQDTSLAPLTRIKTGKPSVICKGDSIQLTAAAAVSYSWSTGDTVQSVTVKKTGQYYVTTVLPCGLPAYDSISITVIDPPQPPQLINDTVCVGDSATLSSLTGDTLQWYENVQAETSIHTGPDFITPPLYTSRNYYAEKASISPEQVFHGGKIDTSGMGQYIPQGKYIKFTCYTSIILDSVTFYAASPRKDSIPLNLALCDEFGGTLERVWFNMAVGKNTIALGFKIPPGNYQLFFPNRGDSIYSNTGGFYYPLDIEGIISVTGSSEGKDKYFYFYNWVIRTSGTLCKSMRVPVIAMMDTSCTVIGLRDKGDGNIFNKTSVFPNPFTDNVTIQVENAPAKGNYTLYITDLTGREVSVLASGENKFILQRGRMVRGFYMFRIHCNKSLLSVGKLMVE